jgi:hypothetical protein
MSAAPGSARRYLERGVLRNEIFNFTRWNKVFGDISSRANRRSEFQLLLNDGNLAADDPEQALFRRVKHSRAGVSGCRDVADGGVEPRAQAVRDCLAGQNRGAGRPLGVATSTGSPAYGGRSQSGMRRILRRTGSFVPSIESRVRSTPSSSPCLTSEAGRSCPAMTT